SSPVARSTKGSGPAGSPRPGSPPACPQGSTDSASACRFLPSSLASRCLAVSLEAGWAGENFSTPAAAVSQPQTGHLTEAMRVSRVRTLCAASPALAPPGGLLLEERAGARVAVYEGRAAADAELAVAEE